jgi:hypothetical protein
VEIHLELRGEFRMRVKSFCSRDRVRAEQDAARFPVSGNLRVQSFYCCVRISLWIVENIDFVLSILVFVIIDGYWNLRFLSRFAITVTPQSP